LTAPRIMIECAAKQQLFSHLLLSKVRRACDR